MVTGAIRAGRAFVEMTLNDAALARGLRRAQRRLRSFGTSVGAIGSQITALAGAAAVPLGLSLRVFTSFSDTMQTVKAVTQAAGQEFDVLNEKAKLLGRTTSFTASQVAGAMVELGRAGFRPVQIDDAIEGVLNLARATDTELPRAAEIAAATLRGFKLEASETGRVADVLAATANNSAQRLDDFGEAMKVLAPIAAEANETLEATSAAVGILANNGIKGSLAGNSLARAYKNLSSTATQKAVQRLGVAVADQEGNLRPLADILREIGQATSNLGTAERLNIFETLFGRGQAAALKLADPGATFDDLVKVLRNADGVAKRTADTMDEKLGGAFRRLLSAVEGIAIAIGESLERSVSSLADTFTDVAGNITQFINQNRDLIVLLFKIGVGVAAAGIALTTLGLAALALSSIIGLLATSISIVLGAIKAAVAVFALLLSPIGLTIAAVGALGATLILMTETGRDALSSLGESFLSLRKFAGRMLEGIANAIRAGNLELAVDVLAAGLKLKFREAVQAISDTWTGFKSFFADVITDVGTAFLEGVKFMADAWTKFTKFLQPATETAARGIARIWAKLTTDLSDEEIEQHLNATISDNVQRELDKQTRILDSAKEQLDLAIAGLKIGNDQFQNRLQDEITEGQENLLELRRQFEAALKNAKDARDNLKLPEIDGDGPDAQTFQDRLNAILNGITNSLESAQQRIEGTGSQGTFNAAAIAQAFGRVEPSTEEKEQTKALKRIDQHTINQLRAQEEIRDALANAAVV